LTGPRARGRRIAAGLLALAAGPLLAGAGPAPAGQGRGAPAVRTVVVDMGGFAPAPLGLDPVPVPRDNPQTPAKIALGRLLFFDKRLSGDGTVSCAGCHDPDLGWSNGLSFAFGVRGQTGRRSAPTVLNAAYSDTLFWDGRADSLEAQAKGPIANPVEMGNTYPVLVRTLSGVPGYVARFEAVFGPGPITLEHVVQAIAAFERTLVSGNSPFDRYKYGGDRRALSAAQVRGMALFKDKAGPNCAKCHRFDDFAADFTDFRFHNVGIGSDHPDPDVGREAVTHRPEDRGRFRTPTLRNVALTAPYMHDGRFATLGQVVDYYAGGARANPDLDPEIHSFELTQAEKADLLAFLDALTGTLPQVTPPAPDAFP